MIIIIISHLRSIIMPVVHGNATSNWDNYGVLGQTERSCHDEDDDCIQTRVLYRLSADNRRWSAMTQFIIMTGHKESIACRWTAITHQNEVTAVCFQRLNAGFQFPDSCRSAGEVTSVANHDPSAVNYLNVTTVTTAGVTLGRQSAR